MKISARQVIKSSDWQWIEDSSYYTKNLENDIVYGKVQDAKGYGITGVEEVFGYDEPFQDDKVVSVKTHKLSGNNIFVYYSDDTFEKVSGQASSLDRFCKHAMIFELSQEEHEENLRESKLVNDAINQKKKAEFEIKMGKMEEHLRSLQDRKKKLEDKISYYRKIKRFYRNKPKNVDSKRAFIRCEEYRKKLKENLMEIEILERKKKWLFARRPCFD